MHLTDLMQMQFQCHRRLSINDTAHKIDYFIDMSQLKTYEIMECGRAGRLTAMYRAILN